MDPLPFDINILTNPLKKSWTVENFKDKLPLNVYQNSAWPMPPHDSEWRHNYTALEPKQEIAYRIFRGHQEALQMGVKDTILMLEDDARPAGDWEWHTKNAMLLLDRFEVVALYAKATNWFKEEFTHYDRKYLIVDKHPQLWVNWTNGAVAYLIRRETAKKFYKDKYLGIPVDLHIPEFYSFCCSVQYQCAFEHCANYGSTFHSPTPP